MTAIVNYSRDVGTITERIDSAIQAGKRTVNYYNGKCVVIVRWSLIGVGSVSLVGGLLSGLYFKESIEIPPFFQMVGGVGLGVLSCVGGCCLYKLSHSLWRAKKAKTDQDVEEQKTRKLLFETLGITQEHTHNIQEQGVQISENTRLLGEQNSCFTEININHNALNERLLHTNQKIEERVQDNEVRVGVNSLMISTYEHLEQSRQKRLEIQKRYGFV